LVKQVVLEVEGDKETTSTPNTQTNSWTSSQESCKLPTARLTLRSRRPTCRQGHAAGGNKSKRVTVEPCWYFLDEEISRSIV
jgi:hypothetical protein